MDACQALRRGWPDRFPSVVPPPSASIRGRAEYPQPPLLPLVQRSARAAAGVDPDHGRGQTFLDTAMSDPPPRKTLGLTRKPAATREDDPAAKRAEERRLGKERVRKEKNR